MAVATYNESADRLRSLLDAVGVECEVLPASDRVVLHLKNSQADTLVDRVSHDARNRIRQAAPSLTEPIYDWDPDPRF